MRIEWFLLNEQIKVFFRSWISVGSTVILLAFYFCALFAGFLSPYEISTQNLEKSYHPPTKLFWEGGELRVQVYEQKRPLGSGYRALEGESRKVKFFPKVEMYKLWGFIPLSHKLMGIEKRFESDRMYLLGSDATGRDVFSRLLHGAQVSLSIGLMGILITFFLGFLVGGFSGYFGGKFDFAAMRFVEFLMAIPGLYLLLALRSAIAEHFESGQMYLMIVLILAFIGWASTARVVRGITSSIRKRQFVLASESLGQSPFRILFKHILPNLSGYLLVAATLSIPAYILGEAALSFLGLGIQEPSASWGLMLRQAQSDMKIFMLGYWWMLAPGVAIFLTVIAFNLLGDRLRDLLDPKSRLEKGKLL